MISLQEVLESNSLKIRIKWELFQLKISTPHAWVKRQKSTITKENLWKCSYVHNFSNTFLGSSSVYLCMVISDMKFRCIGYKIYCKEIVAMDWSIVSKIRRWASLISSTHTIPRLININPIAQVILRYGHLTSDHKFTSSLGQVKCNLQMIATLALF